MAMTRGSATNPAGKTMPSKAKAKGLTKAPSAKPAPGSRPMAGKSKRPAY